MAGLVPAISTRDARCSPKRDRRDKPGDDGCVCCNHCQSSIVKQPWLRRPCCLKGAGCACIPLPLRNERVMERRSAQHRISRLGRRGVPLTEGRTPAGAPPRLLSGPGRAFREAFASPSAKLWQGIVVSPGGAPVPSGSGSCEVPPAEPHPAPPAEPLTMTPSDEAFEE